jgi:hypothetical protein
MDVRVADATVLDVNDDIVFPWITPFEREWTEWLFGRESCNTFSLNHFRPP